MEEKKPPGAGLAVYPQITGIYFITEPPPCGSSPTKEATSISGMIKDIREYPNRYQRLSL
jgi:hypothetical protein